MDNSFKKFIVLNEVESTNNYANQLIMSNAAENGTVVLAQYQSSGRGQKGNFWESEPNKNLLMSIIAFPAYIKAKEQFIISKVTSLAIIDFLETQTDNVKIKWPNDIYIENNKVAGILIENYLKGNVLFSTIIGIGLNLNQKDFFSNAPNPVSLKQITGINYDIIDAGEKIYESLKKWMRLVEKGDIYSINSNYLLNLYKQGEWSWFFSNNLKFEAKITGIGEFGQLQLEKRNGKISEYLFKEIEYLI